MIILSLKEEKVLPYASGEVPEQAAEQTVL